MFFDLPVDQLKTYKPERTEPADFDAFWQKTLAEARKHPLNAVFTPVDNGLKLIDAFDVTFNGYGGQPIKGWFLIPKGAKGPLPVVIEYIGYGGGRGLVNERLGWAVAGYAYFIMDTRGQGSSWQIGDTPDAEMEGGNPQIPGFMTRGILKPETYYYRRLFADAARAIEAARSHAVADKTKIILTGGSQGGGITIAAAGLVPDVAVAMPDVPFLCHYRKAVEMVDTDPYNEIARFCKYHRDKIDTVYRTLSYFDGMNFAARAKADALFSVALMDMICPPSTVFAAFNHYAGKKDIRIWPYNGHEGGQAFHETEKLKFVNTRFA